MMLEQDIIYRKQLTLLIADMLKLSIIKSDKINIDNTALLKQNIAEKMKNVTLDDDLNYEFEF